ncbi:hypothetical protein F5Y09DRAFT_349246 [Xylaria sp. FL1042]|nr:hypothetical protein F5Y09DRAFT_349246 [Xylaria sp. FL1042]
MRAYPYHSILVPAKVSPSDYITCKNLETLRHDALSLAINNIIRINLATTTYAQLINGLPIADIAWGWPANTSSQLLQAYQSAPASSRAFGLRLIELTAAALHEIGV